MSGRTITIPTPDGEFTGYLARPGLSGSGPGVIVIQEIFGVNTEMRRICDMLAKEGFSALCPDLFWRIEHNIILTDHTEEEWGRAFELFQTVDVDKAVADIGSAITTMRSRPECRGEVGAMGFCLGGLLAYLTAARTDVDAAVGYYGVGIQDRLAEADRIEAPLMLHIAGKDQFVPPEAQEAMKEGLKNRPNITLHSYPDQDHAFAREGGAHYDAAAAGEANARTIAFLREHLGG
ncbi:MAG: dienelactone hydrolase family protein [Maricaulaceae bacterium]|jgi:carboxymethylenebutenolidase